MSNKNLPQEDEYLADLKPLASNPFYRTFSEQGVTGMGSHANTVWLNSIICPKTKTKRTYTILFGILGICGAFLYLIFGG